MTSIFGFRDVLSRIQPIAVDEEITQKKEAQPTIKKPESERSEPLIITLPDDENIQRKLREKLEEYKERLIEKEKRMPPDRAPEVKFSIFADTKYKIAICELLLSRGTVNTDELSQKLQEENYFFNPESFDNACAVINNYITGKAEDVYGSSGF